MTQALSTLIFRPMVSATVTAAIASFGTKKRRVFVGTVILYSARYKFAFLRAMTNANASAVATECRMRNDQRGSRSIACHDDSLHSHHPGDPQEKKVRA
ncbi:hypothetical protein Y032_0412g986 [Ancylostoma ceylanicum]|uniref:Secreted protein n=1 Tax=Ancylostoma ceylanicum TaxID=53326 RepID=A0A016X1Q5_9BILA|nr:hypothetical protein Y032_0412g986 [Ancylostoma ceylanicum]